VSQSFVSGASVSIQEDATHLYREAAQAAETVRLQLRTNTERLQKLGEALRLLAPRAVVTCARGSSDHAATYAKYLIEVRLGILTSSAAPSVSSVYAASADLHGTVLLAISQSGASPDLLLTVASAKAAGATIVALVNVEDSPLAQTADYTIPLCAGTEQSVAATKSYIGALAAIIHLVASWGRDEEAALKLKETCGLHAEALSAAELRHGPMALVQAGFPVLIFAQNDETHSGVESLATELAARGAKIMVAGATSPNSLVLASQPAHPAIQPMLLIQSFYRMVNALAVARGFDPDRPPHLRKVTETV
jgi:glucosamine--fructose-6-phosphate aminotransferase (isomerizing)